MGNQSYLKMRMYVVKKVAVKVAVTVRSSQIGTVATVITEGMTVTERIAVQGPSLDFESSEVGEQ